MRLSNLGSDFKFPRVAFFVPFYFLCFGIILLHRNLRIWQIFWGEIELRILGSHLFVFSLGLWPQFGHSPTCLCLHIPLKLLQAPSHLHYICPLFTAWEICRYTGGNRGHTSMSFLFLLDFDHQNPKVCGCF